MKRYDILELLALKQEKRPVDLKCQTCGDVHAHLFDQIAFSQEGYGDRRDITARVLPGQMQGDGTLRPTCGPRRRQSLMEIYVR